MAAGVAEELSREADNERYRSLGVCRERGLAASASVAQEISASTNVTVSRRARTSRVSASTNVTRTNVTTSRRARTSRYLCERTSRELDERERHGISASTNVMGSRRART
jgi:hypothetical protein